MSSMSGYNSLLHPDNRKELGTQGIFGQKESNISTSQPSRGKIQKFDKDVSSDSSDLGGDFSKEELNATWQDVFGAKKTSTMLPIEILQDCGSSGTGSGKSFTGLFDKMSGGSGEQMGSSIKSDTVSGGVSDKAFDSSLPSGQQSKVWQTSQIRHKDQARLGGGNKTFADVVAGTPVLDEGSVETAPNPFSVLEDEDASVQEDHSWKENKLKDTDTVIDDTRKMADSARDTIKGKVNDLGIKDKVSDLKVGATDTINQLSDKLQSGWQEVKNKKVLKSDDAKLSGSSDISEDLHSKDVQKLAVIKSHDEVTIHQKELKSELNKEVMEHGQDVIHHDTAGGIKQSFTGVVDKLSQKVNDTGIVDKISGVFSGSGDSKTTGTGIGNTISSGIDTVKQQASVLSTTISSKASDLGNKMGNQAMQIKEKAIGVTDNLQKKGQAKKQKKKLAAEQHVDSGESTIGNIQHKGGELLQQAKVKVNDLSDTMSTKLQSTGFKQTLNENFQSSRAMFDRFRAKAIPAIQPVVGDVIPTIRSYGTQYYQSLQSFVIELWQNPPYNKMLFNLIVFFNWICPLLFLHTKEAYTVLFGACISLLGQHLIQMRTGTDAFSPLNRLANGIWAPLMFFLWSSNDVGMLGLSMHHHGYLFHLWLRGLLMINTCMCTIDVMEVMHYFDSGAEGGEGFQPFTKVNLTLAPGTGNVLIVPNVSDSMKKQISQLTGKDLKLQQIGDQKDNQQQIGGSSLSSFGGMGSNVQAQQLEDTLQITMKIPASALQAAAKQQGFDSKLSGSGSSDFDSDIQDKDMEFDSFDSFDSDSFVPQKKQQKFETQQDQTIKGGISKRKNII